MRSRPVPSSLARVAMRVAPAPAVQKSVDALMRRMRTLHPRLFKNLERLDKAVVWIEPSDIPHRFLLTLGADNVSLSVAGKAVVPHDAGIRGKLATLLNMLEGRIDGDKLFFSRDIEISGDTSVIVALRNTMDREEIDLLSDAMSLFGPFARPARAALFLADAVVHRVRGHIAEIADETSSAPIDARAARAECEALRDELAQMNTRLCAAEAQASSKKVVAS